MTKALIFWQGKRMNITCLMCSIYMLPPRLLDVSSVVQTTVFHSRWSDQHHPTYALEGYQIDLAGKNLHILVYLKYNK